METFEDEPTGLFPNPLLLAACRLLYYGAGAAVLGLVVFLTASGALRGGEPVRQVALREPSAPPNANVASLRPNHSPLPTYILIGDPAQIGSAAELSAWYGPTEVVIIHNTADEDTFMRRLDSLNDFLHAAGNRDAQVVDLRTAAWFASGR